MKKFMSLFSIIVAVAFFATNVSATVGGPTYISEIAYSAKDNAVYYKVNDLGGRGCPPIVHKIDLSTKKDVEVKSCAQVENEYPSQENWLNYGQDILENIYQNLSYMGSVSLSKNNIDVAVKFLSEYSSPDFPEEVLWSNFVATVTQDDKELGKINFKGCTADQPHVFEGYMVPNSDKMAMLISNKGDCFEGGYVKETLHLVSGVKYYDTKVVRNYKAATTTEPNVGNLVVYAGINSGASELPPTTAPKSPKRNYIIYAVLAALGLGFGYYFGRRKT